MDIIYSTLSMLYFETLYLCNTNEYTVLYICHSIKWNVSLDFWQWLYLLAPSVSALIHTVGAVVRFSLDPQLLALRALCTNSCLSPKLSLSTPLQGPRTAQEFTSQVILRYTWRNRFRFFCTPRHHRLIIPVSCLLFLNVDFLRFSSAVCFVVSVFLILSPTLLNVINILPDLARLRR